MTTVPLGWTHRMKRLDLWAGRHGEKIDIGELKRAYAG